MNGSLQLSDVVADSYRGPLASLVRGMRISRRHCRFGSLHCFLSVRFRG